MFTNLYLKSSLKTIINKSRPLISVVYDNPNSEVASACLQLSALVRAHDVSGQGKNFYDALIDALHIKLKKGLFSCFFNKKILKMIEPPTSYLLLGHLVFDENIKVSNIVLPPSFKTSSPASWFNKHKKILGETTKIICLHDSDIARYLEKRNYYGLVTYGNNKKASVSYEDASEYKNGYRWKLITDGKTLPISLNGINSEKQIIDWLVAIALVKSAGISLASVMSQFQLDLK